MSKIRNWSFFLSALAASALLSSLAVVFAQTKASQRQVVPETTSSSEVVEQGGGAYYALVIGIANYPKPMPKLITPVSDANEVEKILRVSYGFKTQLLPDATRDQILTALDHDKHTLSENDSLLIYYAGHGFYDKSEDQAYWAPVDAGQDTYARWITATEITSKARAIPARHVLVISDSCYSGKLARAFDPSAGPGYARDPYIIRMLQGKSRDLMSSGGHANLPPPHHSRVVNHTDVRTDNITRFSEKSFFNSAATYHF